MDTNKKRILAGALFLGSLAVWVPQLVGQSAELEQASDDPDPESAAFLHPSFAADARALPSGLGSALPEGGQRSENAAATQQNPSAADPLAAGTAPGRNFAPQPREELLGRLAQVWGQDSAGAGAPELGLLGHDGAYGLREQEQLDQFLATHPLGGILLGSGQAAAILGPRLVRVGDELLGGTWTVASIARRHVELQSGARILRLELPPLTVPAGSSAAPNPPAPAGPTAPQPASPERAAEPQVETAVAGDQQP